MLTFVEKLYIISSCRGTLKQKIKKSGNDGIEETLLPIPNRKVKLYNGDGTARETVWESSKLLGHGSLAQLVRATGS